MGFVINLAVTKMTRYYKYNYNKTLYIKAPFIYILILEIWKIKNMVKLGKKSTQTWITLQMPNKYTRKLNEY